MQNTNKIYGLREFGWAEWSRKDSEDLVRLYIQDYYETLDEYYLREALQIAKDDGIDFESLMRQVRFLQA